MPFRRSERSQARALLVWAFGIFGTPEQDVQRSYCFFLENFLA
jgi:hypothetical protein